jgi:hypothetical protein
MESAITQHVSLFISKHKEKASLNQYWYSQRTIEVIVKVRHLQAKLCKLFQHRVKGNDKPGIVWPFRLPSTAS